ncbi:hypothetical protein EUAN_19340 [Andreesenia angusta]|uniref:Putative Se/S carrier protein-like domain-containing protein n=1 Tax=Andreesenia angusta TaxID=39480 RepID=A0A1S1V7B7_9FIRM|nr:DUF3343 domain-containing protein [Andreesenia angusta]OHW61619.1 hypothetical protein EUAN_19340 [Andreesenia angusta]
MIEVDNFVISFNSTHHAIKSEKRLKEEGIELRMIPTPREITASCGLSVKFEEKDLDKVKGIMENLVENEDISIKGIFRIIRNSKERTATKIY